MHMGDFTNAQIAFRSISNQMNNYSIYDLAQLQLAKISLLNQQFNETLETLSPLSHRLSQDHVLNTERIYLKGWALLAQHKEPQAALCFEELLPKALISKTKWSQQVLNGLILSYLRQALATQSTDLDLLQTLFFKAEFVLKRLLSQAPTENSYLLLSDFYLIKAKCLSDGYSYTQAQHVLDRPDLFSSEQGLRLALLKRAAAAPSYQERSQLYHQLSCHTDYPPIFCANVWFLKGLNDFEEGLRCQTQQPLNQNNLPFEEAAQAFKFSQFRLEQKILPSQTA